MVSNMQAIGEQTGERPVRQETREDALSREKEGLFDLDSTVVIEGPVVRLVHNRTTLDDLGHGALGWGQESGGRRESGSEGSKATKQTAGRSWYGGEGGGKGSKATKKTACCWQATQEPTSCGETGGNVGRDKTTQNVRGQAWDKVGR